MNELMEYFRDKHGTRKKGILYAVDKNKIGWSLWNPKYGIKFNRENGVKAARGRAIKGTHSECPHSLTAAFQKMCDRAERYYQKALN